jgi:hypothetical protein
VNDAVPLVCHFPHMVAVAVHLNSVRNKNSWECFQIRKLIRGLIALKKCFQKPILRLKLDQKRVRYDQNEKIPLASGAKHWVGSLKQRRARLNAKTMYFEGDKHRLVISQAVHVLEGD